MELLQHTLPNGIRLVHFRVNDIVGHCGLIINTGSRDENNDQHGMTHFIEHMLFKGTHNRKPYHILSRLEDVGGELNAYTTKEETAIHASFMIEHYERAMEIIYDITFNSIFPEKEIEKEKDVVIEEINSYKDNPAELIFDDFEEIVFKNQPIGRNILGTEESVKLYTREKILEFLSENYSTEEIVFCSVGNISDDKLLKLFNKYFADIPNNSKPATRRLPELYQPSLVTRVMNTYQNHCIIGNVAYDLMDKRRMGLFILNNILGGQGLNSRLNLSLREKNGFAYNVESSYSPYCDTGVFSIYFGTDSHNLEKSIDIAMYEMNKLCTTKLGTMQLGKAKNQIKGYLARGYENHESLMLSLGKSLLVFNKIEPLEETYRKIDKVSASEIMETANDIFSANHLSTLIYK